MRYEFLIRFNKEGCDKSCSKYSGIKFTKKLIKRLLKNSNLVEFLDSPLQYIIIGKVLSYEFREENTKEIIYNVTVDLSFRIDNEITEMLELRSAGIIEKNNNNENEIKSILGLYFVNKHIEKAISKACKIMDYNIKTSRVSFFKLK